MIKKRNEMKKKESIYIRFNSTKIKDKKDWTMDFSLFESNLDVFKLGLNFSINQLNIFCFTRIIFQTKTGLNLFFLFFY